MATPASAQGEAVALELLLAVDGSSSVSSAEFRLQMEGIARGFEDPQVLAAIDSLGPSGLAVALLQWSSLEAQALVIGWTQVTDPTSARRFAAQVRRTPRLIAGGATAMSSALEAATATLRFNRYVGDRMVIDISGDGRANEGESPAHARIAANRAGITVNGLAILNEEPGVAEYYQAWVIGGPGSFLMTAIDSLDFQAAMRRKLLTEILGPAIAALPGSPQVGLAAPALPQ